MPARAYWSGQIRLALVSIPVQLFTATKTAARISFNQIHKPTGKRIRYEKVVPGVGAVDADEIVRGYEVEKGKYVLFEDEEIDDVKLEAKRTIDLVQFVDEDEIDDVYFANPLYVAPDDDDVAGEAYVVLRDAMKSTGKVGLGQLVVRGKSSIVCLKPHGKGLAIETLRYADEVHKADQFFADVPDVEPESELLSMAEELIRRKVKPFDAKAFKDPYESALRELIQAKLEDRPPEEIDMPEVGAQVINLMDALKKSMSAEGAKAPAAKGRGKKTAAKSAAAEKKSAAAKAGDKKTGARGRRAA
jgi:DNA end-binding protein Ku